MTGRIWAIAINTFREAVRDRVLYGVLAFAGAILFFTVALAELSLEENRRVVTDIGLAAISLFTVLVSVFLGSSLLYKEIEKKTLYLILPRPIRRWEFLVGKYLGIVLTGVVFIAIMGALQVALTWMQDRADLADLQVVVAALLLIVGELAVLTAVALLFSSFSTPFLTGVLTFGVWLVGRSAQAMAEIRSDEVPASIKDALRGLSRVVPNFHLFVPDRAAMMTMIEAQGTPFGYVGQALSYAVAYIIVLLVAAILIFRRRDLL